VQRAQSGRPRQAHEPDQQQRRQPGEEPVPPLEGSLPRGGALLHHADDLVRLQRGLGRGQVGEQVVVARVEAARPLVPGQGLSGPAELEGRVAQVVVEVRILDVIVGQGAPGLVGLREAPRPVVLRPLLEPLGEPLAGRGRHGEQEGHRREEPAHAPSLLPTAGSCRSSRMVIVAFIHDRDAIDGILDDKNLG